MIHSAIAQKAKKYKKMFFFFNSLFTTFALQIFSIYCIELRHTPRIDFFFWIFFSKQPHGLHFFLETLDFYRKRGEIVVSKKNPNIIVSVSVKRNYHSNSLFFFFLHMISFSKKQSTLLVNIVVSIYISWFLFEILIF